VVFQKLHKNLFFFIPKCITEMIQNTPIVVFFLPNQAIPSLIVYKSDHHDLDEPNGRVHEQ
jgi:hypothetical protein